MRKKPWSTAAAVYSLVIAGLIFSQLLSLHYGSDPDEGPPGRSDDLGVTVPPELEDDVRAAQSLLARDPDDALVHIERALARADGAGPELRALLHTWAADVHARRWHLHRARDALNIAIGLASSATRRRTLANVEEAIQRAQGERGEAAFYYAPRGIAPAAELSGRVVVAYLLVDPVGPGRWTDVDRVYARSTLARVERWYAEKARARAVRAPEFVDRIFEVPLAGGDLPLLKDINFARRTAWQLASNLGYPSVNRMMAALAAEEGADQAMLLLHVPQRGRSFASPCTSSAYCDGEIAFIYAPNGHDTWDSLAYALAHEGLHLFGADDLYNVRGAEDYEPTDVMHYASLRLEYADLGDLTAWAVGWTRDRPNTPFAVEE